MLKKASPNHPETLFFEAQFTFNGKDYKKTREITEQVLKGFPNNVRVLELAGAAEFRMKNYIQAEALLAKALKLAPQQRLSRLLLAQTYLRNGEPSKALDALKPVLDTGKADGTTLSLAGEAYLQLGDAARSEQAFQAALKAAPDDARVRLSAVPGIGAWTVAEIAQRALGDSDALSVGDYHLSQYVGWALAGKPLDDAGMVELLEPWRPHRYRVVRLIECSGYAKPRFGPKLTIQDHRRH